MTPCPVCDGSDFEVAVSKESLEEEYRIRDAFIAERSTRPLSEEERKDLTEFFHNGPAQLLRCRACGQLVRHELHGSPAASYGEDSNSRAVMERQYPCYVDAFRSKEIPYRAMLPSGARIMEVGSHYGAFLQTAAEWGWRAEGIDVGADTSSFARSKGHTVHQKELSECRFENSAFDGVFIWNCFEQIESPKELLAECHRILKPNALLVLRTPNAFFYGACEDLLGQQDLTDSTRVLLVDALAYNNLLGFPYLYGYSAERLARIGKRHGFASEGMLNSELLGLPLPRHPAWVRREETAIDQQLKVMERWALEHKSEVILGPWVEVWLRRST